MKPGVHAFTMPKWGLTMEKGTVAAWNKAVGDPVAEGEEICDVETEKIANGVESKVTGVLRRIIASEGSELPIGALLGIIAAADVSDSDIDAAVEEFQASYVPPTEGEGEAGDQPETIEVAGRRVRHLIHRGSGDAIVLVHGFGGNLENWLLNHSALCEGGRTVAAMDLPGHGESSKTLETGSLKELRTAVLDYMDAVGVQKAHLVGHSLGGGICIGVALAAPDRVASLSLLATGGIGQPVDEEFIRGFANATGRKDLKPVLQKLFADPEMVTRQLVEDTLKYKRLEGVSGALQKLADTVLGGAGSIDILRKLTAQMPVTVIWGDKDAVLAVPDAAAVSATGAKFNVLPGVGHMLMVEAADQVNKLIVTNISK